MPNNTYIQLLLSITENNKYRRWYIQICERAMLRTSSKRDAKNLYEYIETHHIIPKSFQLGGERDKSNLTHLTPREHYLCHILLTKCTVDQYYIKSNFAAWAFIQNNLFQGRTSKSK